MASLGEPPLRAEAADCLDAFRRHEPTAVLVGIDEGVEVYRRLSEAGVRIPGDCSFVGLFNEPPAAPPNVARPILPIKETGYEAADRILWRIAHPNRPFEYTRIVSAFHPGDTAAAR